MAEAPQPERTQVFTRQATGLRREASAADVFIYNTNNQNIGIGVAFMILLIPAFYAGANIYVATLIAAAISLPMAAVYAYFAGTMPRSGGDYVYVSRTLHPAIGFVTSWNWVVWMLAYVGIPAAFFGQYGLSGFFRLLGASTGSERLAGWGDWFGTPWGIWAAGTALILFFTVVFASGTRLYFLVQRVTFSIAMGGVLLVIGILLFRSPDVVARFNEYVASVGGSDDAFGAARAAAEEAGFAQGGFTWRDTMLAAVWPLYITLYAITSSFIGGEVRNARRSQFLGMPGAVVYVTVFMLLLTALVMETFGGEFLGIVGAAGGGAIGLSAEPTYNELAGMLVYGSVVLAFLVGLAFVFWTYVWLPINYLASTRALLAWSFDGLLPRKLSEVSPRTHTPIWSILLVAVLGQISLILFATGVIDLLVGIFAWIISFCITCFAAIVFPYRRRELFEASPYNRRVAGIPVISIVATIALAGLLLAEWAFWVDPIQGLETSRQMQVVTVGVFVSGFLFYAVAAAIQRRRGVRVERVFAEIPPE
jgi:amino acid transporter